LPDLLKGRKLFGFTHTKLGTPKRAAQPFDQEAGFFG
jgi:hypothetical protein